MNYQLYLKKKKSSKIPKGKLKQLSNNNRRHGVASIAVEDSTTFLGHGRAPPRP
jgi:hypothetical protein